MKLRFFYCEEVIIVYIVPHASDKGIPATMAASVLSTIAEISIIGRLSIGFISDRIGSRLTQRACLFMMTLALIWLLFIKAIWMFYSFAVVLGLAYGGIASLLTVVTADFLDLKFLGTMLGGLFLIGMIGRAVGAPLSGSIFDITGNYSLAFLICIASCAVAVILSLVLLRYNSKTSMTQG
jgi:MFS family permease